jgi:hypothetical protein
MVPAVVPVQDDPVEFVVSFQVVPSHHLILLAVQVKSPALPAGLVQAECAGCANKKKVKLDKMILIFFNLKTSNICTYNPIDHVFYHFLNAR